MKNRRKGWKKRIGSLLLALGLLLGSLAQPTLTLEAAVVQNAWDGSSRSIPETDESGTFLITSGAELAWFADYVNAGHGEINGRLVNNIYLNTSQTSYAWVIIGNTQNTPYRGTFDGNGKQILNLRVKLSTDQPSQRYGGLFGVIDGGLVQNLRVTGTIQNNYADKVSSTDHELYSASGGIVGYLKSGSLVNCTNTAKTTVGSFSFYRNAGGIAGISGGVIIRCRNEGNLAVNVKMGQYRMGGIVGSMYGSEARTLYCENYGTVNGFFQVGGIAGCMQYGAEILSCCNYGNLSGRETIGGIVGKIAKAGSNSDGSSKQSLVRDVYSLGEITECNRYAGGIIGECGYDDGEDMDNPAMPVIENAYSTMQLSSIEYGAAIISYFKSGSLGNAYGLDRGILNYNPVGQTRAAATKITDTVEMLTEEDLKAGTMVTRLGSSFVVCSKFFEEQNSGYPMLAWQIQTNSLAGLVNDAVLELVGWLTETNKEKYGENYTTIESLVNTYVSQLGQITTATALNTLMEEARAQLAKVPRSHEEDQELAEAIDNAITKLEEYLETKLASRDDLTQDQIQGLEALVTTYTAKLDQATSLVEVDDLLAAGKKALDEKLEDYDAQARLEVVRTNALQVLTSYRTDREYAEPWKSDISTARNKGLRLIGQADSVSGVNTALSQAKASIDAIIDQIPEEGAWDGDSSQEPAQNEQGLYQISNGAELAWFAQAVNQGNTTISAELVSDISLGNKNWTPIGASKAYTGNFNGNGYTIRGLRITEGASAAGLFGILGGSSTQTIQNLTVIGSISCDRSAGYAGGIAAYVQSQSTTYLDNCHSQVDINISRITTRDGAVGGLVGYAKNAVIQNCSNQGSVVISSVAVGGLSYHSGGLAGYLDENVTLTRSYNSGYVEAEYCAGGLAGTLGGKDNTIVIEGAYNLGEVQGGSYGGGLIGLVNTSITMNCCYSTGGVNLSHNGRYLGALFGGAKKGNISNLYVLKRSDQPNRLLVGYSSGYNASGSFVSETDLQSDDMLNRLNQAGTNFIKDYLNQQNGYPLLEWEMSLEEFRLGVTTELQTLVSSENYTEENWSQVVAQIDAGLAAVQAAGSREEINAAYTAAKEAIYAIETKEEAQKAALEAAKEAAVDFLKNYVDPSLYREEEQLEISQAITDGTKWILSAETQDQVAEYLNQAKENIDALPTAAQYQYEIDAAAAAEVDAYIDGIGEVVFAPYVRLSISQARNAYDSLTEDQQLLVQKYQTLLDAEAEYKRLEEEYDITDEDKELAALVEEKITAIGEVSLESQSLIRQARTAYDALQEKQQALVTNLNTLLEAEKAYNTLRAREVSVAIAAIGEVSMDKLPQIQAAQTLYDALTEAQKALVTDYQILVKARSNYENMVAAAAVVELIDKIGTVTLDSGSAIQSAILAYNNLSSDQQALVTNYDTLEAASIQYENMAAINQVEELIDRIGAVTTASGNLISQARSAYDALSSDLQASVYNRDQLFQAEAAYSTLQNNSQRNLPDNSSYSYDTVDSGGGRAYSQTGQNENATARVAGDSTETKKQTEVADSAQAGENQTATKEETGGESALDKLIYEEEGTQDSQEAMAISLEADQAEVRDHRRKTLILGILVSAAAAIDLALGLVFRKASKKRKEKLMRY